MDDRLRDLFVDEVEMQCQFIVVGAQGLNAALRQTDDDHVIWYHVQSMLVAAANVSKLLWGSGGKMEAEREPVRAYLGVTNDSPIRDTDLRNHLEHIDSRLERWHVENLGQNFVGRAIGPLADILATTSFGPREDVTTRFHHYDTETTRIAFWGRTASLQEIVNDAQIILGALARQPRP